MTAVRRDLLADARALIECESPSTDLAAVARSAEGVARVGAARRGVAPERIVLDGRTHLRWRLGTGPSRVLLLGHHDTVWPLGALADHPCTVEEGILRGPGCFDMKAGLVMAFHAAAGLDGVTLLVTGDEELGSPSSRGLIEQEARAATAALVLEASADGALKTERKGVSLYEVRVAGRAAHAGLEPERGGTPPWSSPTRRWPSARSPTRRPVRRSPRPSPAPAPPPTPSRPRARSPSTYESGPWRSRTGSIGRSALCGLRCPVRASRCPAARA